MAMESMTLVVHRTWLMVWKNDGAQSTDSKCGVSVFSMVTVSVTVWRKVSVKVKTKTSAGCLWLMGSLNSVAAVSLLSTKESLPSTLVIMTESVSWSVSTSPARTYLVSTVL